MTARFLLHAATLLCLVVSACQGDALSVGGGDPLQPEDVNDMSPGDAVGEAVTGAYLFTGFDTRSCFCRSGSEAAACDDLYLAGDGLWLVQDDGALEVRLFRGEEIGDDLVVRGGIDADGTVRVGGVNTVVTEAGQAIGQTTNDVEGTVASQGRGELTWATRFEAVLGSESVDCDVVIDVSIAWWDPASIPSCSFASDCHPARPLCVDDVCTATAGESGDACTFGRDCASGVCQAGACAAADDCEVFGCPGEQICFEGACQVGSEGDPCDTSVRCSADAFICFRGRCQDGSAGDSCQSNFECAALDGFSCGPSDVCE